MLEEKIIKDKKTYRWCEKREQHVDIEVCETQASIKKFCCKCLGQYNQLSLFSADMIAGDK